MKKRLLKNRKINRKISWLMTFNDMITLLMVFFVLLFTMGSVDMKKMKRFQNSLQSALGVLKEGEHTGIKVKLEDHLALKQDVKRPKEKDNGKKDGAEKTPKHDSDNLNNAINIFLKGLDPEYGIKAHFTPKGVLLTLEDKLLFKLGRAEINRDSFQILDKIATFVKELPNEIRIEGHTDNTPIHNDRFPSNWELSTARAVNVVKYFIKPGKINPFRLSAVGYGESKPVYPNDTHEHKAENRRVEIILVRNSKS